MWMSRANLLLQRETIDQFTKLQEEIFVQRHLDLSLSSSFFLFFFVVVGWIGSISTHNHIQILLPDSVSEFLFGQRFLIELRTKIIDLERDLLFINSHDLHNAIVMTFSN